MDKYIGKRLDGRYEIRELIGVGGMANVYKAYDLVESRWVAVKILRDEYMDNDEFLRRFRNESKAVATLSHPNIVKVYDVSFSQKMHSIVMEFIDGITLKDFIDRQGKLGWKETVHFTIQILRALQHAHDNGIVHRDIKPQNIMLLSDGTIKVTDFGIARFARSVTKTITDRAIGSVHYISPEQARGGTIDEKTDIYSVGVMMYEMLTGKLPFEADSPVSVALKQIQVAPMRPTLINPEIPEGLEAITMRAMEKDPARRYQSAAEMLRDIDQFKHNPSISFAYKYLSQDDAGQAARTFASSDHPTQSTRVHNSPQGFGPNGYGQPAPMPPDNGGEDDDDEDPPRIPFLSVLTGITVAFVLVSAIFVGTMFYFNNPFKTVEDIDVPNLVGEKFDTVKYDPSYAENDIKVVMEKSEFNNKYPNGVIFEQDPKAGRPMKKGSTIRVKVSVGAKMITLMDLSGMESNEAYALLKEKGLETFNEMRIYDDNVPEGYVVKTDPEPNTQVDAETEIQVYVSQGRENKLLTMPSIQYMKLNDAKRLLNNFGLTIGNVKMVANEMERGTIVSQIPAPDSEVPQGTPVDVEVSAGDEDASALSITVKLPPLKSLLTVEAWLDGTLAHEARLTPGAGDDANWEQVYEGYGTKLLEIRINGVLYQQLEVDFEDGVHRRLVDNSSLFANGVPEGEVPGPVAGSSSPEDEDRHTNDEQIPPMEADPD